MNKHPLHAGLANQRFFPLPANLAADGWQVRGRLTGAALAAPVEIPSQYFKSDGATWVMTWPGDQSTDLETGDCILVLIATDTAGLEFHAGQEDVRVFAQAEKDLRSQTKKDLDAFMAVQSKTATTDEMARSFGGRSISRIPPLERVALIQGLERKYKREQNALAGIKPIQTVNLELTQ